MPHSTIVTVAHCDVARWTSVTAVIVTVLRYQPEAFALDLGDDQSRYLWPLGVWQWLAVAMLVSVAD